MTLPCYNFYLTPIIETVPSPWERNPVTRKGWAAIGVLRHLPQAQLDTSALCSSDREVVAARVRHGGLKMVLASIYIRPRAKPKDGETASWIRGLVELADGDPLIVAGDFNAPHKKWGYATNTKKGRELLEAMRKEGLELQNETGVKTRLAKQQRQKDTTPDLTWITGDLTLEWKPWRDTLGSDHYPIELKVAHCAGRKGREVRPIIKWDRFREIVTQNIGNDRDIEVCIQEALTGSKTQISVKRGSPTPDTHLLNLWASRLQALQKYRKVRTTPQKIKLNIATAKATRYSKELGRTRWRAHCGSFNEKTGLGKAWRTYRGMDGKRRKARNAAQNLALRLNITEEEMAVRAGELFFPQVSAAPPRTSKTSERTHTLEAPAEPGMEDQLNMGELLEAIYTANTGSAPGPDGITYQALRNLPEEAKQKLLDSYNEVWNSGVLPRQWKLSWVTPIPKPGKLQDRIENLRPVSLTSNICKTMEKIVSEDYSGTWKLTTSSIPDKRVSGRRWEHRTASSSSTRTSWPTRISKTHASLSPWTLKRPSMPSHTGQS